MPRAEGTATREPAQSPMRLGPAVEYTLALVNRDRAAEGLLKLTYDPVAAKAAQRHVEDMVCHGFTAHIGSDGSVPEQRYTDAGGAHMVQENAACFFDEEKRTVDPDARFESERIARIQQAFLHELPPDDGHRRNILSARHTAVGIGLAKPAGVEALCVVQEFVDAYADYETIPRALRAGATLRVAGDMRPPAKFGGIGIARLPERGPSTASRLNATSSYRIPTPTQLYFASGFKTPVPVQVSGQRFEVDLPIGHEASGLHALSVWAQLPRENSLVMVGLRTFRVRGSENR